jgi:hypothetical protein
MTETKLRTLVSIFLMVSHIVILLMVLVLFLKAGLTEAEFTTSMGIMVPALSGLATLAVTYAISMKGRKQYAARSERLSGIYVFTALLFPSVFVLLMAGLVLMKSFDRFSSFEQFKLSLGAVETIFAGYTGKVMASLFGSGTPA